MASQCVFKVNKKIGICNKWGKMTIAFQLWHMKEYCGRVRSKWKSVTSFVNVICIETKFIFVAGAACPSACRWCRAWLRPRLLRSRSASCLDKIGLLGPETILIDYTLRGIKGSHIWHEGNGILDSFTFLLLLCVCVCLLQAHSACHRFNNFFSLSFSKKFHSDLPRWWIPFRQRTVDIHQSLVETNVRLSA